MRRVLFAQTALQDLVKRSRIRVPGERPSLFLTERTWSPHKGPIEAFSIQSDSGLCRSFGECQTNLSDEGTPTWDLCLRQLRKDPELES